MPEVRLSLEFPIIDHSKERMTEMWPKAVEWKKLKYGVEIEFIGGCADSLELLPDWTIARDEQQLDETGAASGSELQTPPIGWEDREQIRVMLSRLRDQGASANWSCGLHVHVGLEPWGAAILLPLIDAALLHQQAIRALLNTSEHRLIYCPPVIRDMRQRFIKEPDGRALRHQGRPQSHRCGINAAAWFDIGTVEIRYANGSLEPEEVINTIELCLRYVAAVGEGATLPDDPQQLAAKLDAPSDGYPPHTPAPVWYRERAWLEDALIPLLTPLVAELLPDGEIHHLTPVHDGFLVAVEQPGGKLTSYSVQPPSSGWKLVRQVID
jgi:hypothetical protein